MDGGAWWATVHGVFQARVLQWFAISFSRGSSHPRDRTQVSRIVGRHTPAAQPAFPSFHSCDFGVGEHLWVLELLALTDTTTLIAILQDKRKG